MTPYEHAVHTCLWNT